MKELWPNEVVLGKDHPHTPTLHENTGQALCFVGNCKVVLECHQKALSIHESVLGQDNPKTSATHHNVGAALQDQVTTKWHWLTFKRPLPFDNSY